MRKGLFAAAVALAAFAAPGIGQEAPKPAGQPAGATEAAPAAQPASAATPRYTFSWPLNRSDVPQPRGGTTRGAPVKLATEPSQAWRALQEKGLSPLERDRRAILAMAGEYQVTFDFLEIDSFKADGKRDRPYQSWGTEKVYVDRDDGKAISLVHMLEMRVVQNDGSISEPMVTKHWRQDWQYEPRELVEFKGEDRWQRRDLKREESAGRWSQTVVQVDESPRYSSVGKWEHSPSFSSWISGETWRPLPRREWSVRKDYNVLVGTNRHTITPAGWVQEENNLKTVLTDDRAIDAAQPYRAREYGVARYARLAEADFKAADQYYERTRKFWASVQTAWAELFRQNAVVTLSAPVDQAGLFKDVFEYADELASGKTPAAPADQVIRDSLRKMGAPPLREARR
jgi:hypothetical protein